MNLLTVRKRILNFRLTEDEYQCLHKASKGYGARNVSDYARSILLGPRPADGSRSLTDEILSRLNELETRVTALAGILRAEQPGDPDSQ